ncbi:MAG TPA: nucleoside triphosphate pyrophosphohydrolase [Syntrophales bacterium]|nr:nucleoside triphosphate pyrophosphohydrolase [Syntrophales bacterium]HOX95476.1 nucleoside triphosphate pyrophosphohydrolase [Syntrophales bacterium]HPI56479.1 nucleoside triphosphate pyrophosphohydrolase [Syntrophales bacterium]HPN25100.1 nucleoside triphosphate pyrophosphohydrolase [Syntrophales bacterium]HQM29157.1 nucleoside triphosphate pyrophosphohydrolase [Syntrophales bacterium]
MRLLEIMEQLRSPRGGCPWDLRQSERDIGQYLLEEAYEVLEAIESGSPDALREELGDLLFQIVFLARLSEEKGSFDMNGILEEIARKMVRRHPHVFGNVKVKDAQDVKDRWDEIKRNVEKKERTDLFMGTRIPRSLPALARAQRIVAEASRAGFDLAEKEALLNKVEDDLEAFKKAWAAGRRRKLSETLGDLLFTMAELGSLARVDAEEALKSASGKFAERMTGIDRKRREQDKTPSGVSSAGMERPWKESGKFTKRADR